MTGVIWLVSYPKSGNTWLRLALLGLLQPGRAVEINESLGTSFTLARRRLFDETLDVESADLTPEEAERARPFLHRLLAAGRDATIFKVHDAWTRGTDGAPLFPPDIAAKVIYIVRDPRDVAVSFAHHMGRSVDRAIAAMADVKTQLARTGRRLERQLPQRLLTWSGHVESWLDASDLRPHVIRYEDMLADPAGILAAAARFCDLDASEETVTGAVEATRFDVLRAQEEEHGFVERPAHADRFFRRGLAGGWRDSLTPEQAARVIADHGRVMVRLGYET